MHAITRLIHGRAAGLLSALVFLTGTAAFAQDGGGAEKAEAADCPQSLRYVFSWSMENNCNFTVRGGTTTGTEVRLDPEPHPGWLSLQEEGLDKHERDRRAILAMAGPYRASFEFLETVGYTPDFERARPYRSWGTEYVHVVADREDFISLQHIIVMFIQGEEGEVMGPFVQKHWRQDWAFEQAEILAYAGNGTWERRAVDAAAREGAWMQSVYQVDDSPRYESWGRWEHRGNLSTWRSEETWRPLPRREFSVRDDYDVLVGWNRHTIVPEGWVHEEENYKVRLDESGEPAETMPFIAKEQGVNRYERIVDFDWSAGDEYWNGTSAYWEDVRAVWAELFESADSLRIVDDNAEGVPLFAALFQEAEAAMNAEDHDSAETRERVRRILEGYVE